MRKFWCLLDGANRANESGTARDGEDAAQTSGGLVGSKRGKLGDRCLHRRNLAEVDEARQRAYGPCEKGRPGAWRPDDEHEPVVQSAEALAERGATPRREALRHPKVVRGRLENGVHRPRFSQRRVDVAAVVL